MKIPEVIKLADDLIFSHTGKHLDYIQKAIINGTLEHKNYTTISDEINCSESHVKNTGAELWQVLSNILGEDITKKNFKHIFNNAKIYNNFSPSFVSDNLTVSNLNFCGEKQKPGFFEKPGFSKEKETDLSYVPRNVNFYGRSLELSFIKQWILNDQVRLINIYGLSEVGKSSLIGYFITQIKEHFDYIIWRNLTQFFTLNQLTDNLNQYFLNSEKPPFSHLLDYILNYRCLIILDDLQTLFKTGDFAGEFLPEYEDYSKFFQQVVTSSHESCVITISWEKPRSLSSLEGKKSPLKTLELKGFDYQNTDIFRENNLLDQDKWSELMSLYQGHPSFLNIISGIIN